MADADKELKIKITTEAETAKVGEYSRSLDQVTRQTDVAAKATGRWVASKTQLRAAVRGLMFEFPLLGRVAALALNPITLAIAGVATAFKLWSSRMEEAKRVLGGVEMPDLIKLPPERITAAAEAWLTYSKALAEVAAKAQSLEESSRKATAALAEKWDLIEGLGGGGTRAEKDRARQSAAEQARTAANLAIRGRGRLRAAGDISIATEEEDQNTLANLEARAAVAQGEISDSQANLQMLGNYTGKSWLRRGFSFRQAKQLYMRYGFKSSEEIRAIEMARQARFQGDVDRLAKFRGGLAGRNALRSQRTALIEGGVADLAASQAGFAESDATDRAGQRAFALSELAAGRNIVPSQFGAGNSVRADVVAEIRKTYSLILQMEQIYKQQNVQLTQRVNDLQKRMTTKPE